MLFLGPLQAQVGKKATSPRKLTPAPEGIEVLRDITFATVDEQKLQLDLYLSLIHI